jgi:hypothetical protein
MMITRSRMSNCYLSPSITTSNSSDREILHYHLSDISFHLIFDMSFPWEFD